MLPGICRDVKTGGLLLDILTLRQSNQGEGSLQTLVQIWCIRTRCESAWTPQKQVTRGHIPKQEAGTATSTPEGARGERCPADADMSDQKPARRLARGSADGRVRARSLRYMYDPVTNR